MSSHNVPKTSGIYKITCTVTEKFYIGSAMNLASRRHRHFHGLRNNVHHSITLQRAWNKYGPDAFTFEVLELVLPPFLLEREQHWLDTLKPFDPAIGYNIDSVAGSRIGHTVSPETREKLRQANLGKKHSEETIRKLAEANKGRTHTDEAKEKVRLANLGQKRSKEACESMKQAQLGKKHSPETIEKMRIARTGHTRSFEARDKISASNIISNEWRMKTLIVTSPDGTEYIAHGIGQFCKEHNLNRSALTQVAKGKAKHHKGWTARFP